MTMDRLPPRIVRRLVVDPVAFVLCLGLLATSPVILLLAFVADVFLPGSWRTLRLATFGVVYVVFEVIGLLVMLGLWIATGFGLLMRTPWGQEAHYRVMKGWLAAMNGAVARLFRLRIRIEDRPKPQPGPVLVFSRHAGPGNSLMLVGTLMIAYDRHPRIVMLAKLQWEPLFDVMGNRLPNRFIRHDPKGSARYVAAIGELARGLEDRDALVLFPEGRDFTRGLRLRAIAHLRKKGFHRHADKAEAMGNVLPPRHRGPMAAITSAPEADVVFVAHTVLEDIGSIGDLWRRIPLREPIDSRYWRIPPSEVPSREEELIDWLYGWWKRIDDWINEHVSTAGAKDAAPPAISH
jgi:1-acyl-sn-glycerol-3-phosphate acyltransferase